MTNEEKLIEYAKRYDCDKLQHGYLPFYAKYLPEKIHSMLEIGLWHGAGARMFDDYFGHVPEIHVLDLFGEEGNMTEREARRLEFVPHKGSQSDLNFLYTITHKFSFIEEDASHNSFDMIASFKHLFLHNLVPGGLWVTEDLHCCTDPFYWSGMEEIKSVDDTMLGMAKHFLETGKIVNPFFNEGESDLYERLIDRMELVCGDKLLFIWRK